MITHFTSALTGNPTQRAKKNTLAQQGPALSVQQTPSVVNTPQTLFGDRFEKQDNTSLRFAGTGRYGNEVVLLNKVDTTDAPLELKKLVEAKDKIEAKAKEFGLTPLPVRYYLMPPERFFSVAARDGYPDRYSHYSWGREFKDLKRDYDHGLRRFYDTVGFNAPVYSYLMDVLDTHALQANMAKAVSNSDFFANNLNFSEFSKDGVARLRNNAERMRELTSTEGVGPDVMKSFLTKAHSVRFLVEPVRPGRSLSKTTKPTSGKPDRDVLAYVIQNSHVLKDWEKEALSIVRDESYTVLPSMRTKVMRHGWSAFWNEKLNLENPELADFSKAVPEAKYNAEVFRPGKVSINTYSLGYEIFKSIEDRWNKGHHGDEWDQADSFFKEMMKDNGDGKGIEKAFDVRRLEDDASFIQQYLTPDVVHKLNAYTVSPDEKQTHKQDPTTKLYISSREFRGVRKALVEMFLNGGNPIIEVVNGNYNNEGELLLKHQFEYGLERDYAEQTVKNLEQFWGKPVYLETKLEHPKVGQMDVRIGSVEGRIRYYDLDGDEINFQQAEKLDVIAEKQRKQAEIRKKNANRSYPGIF